MTHNPSLPMFLKKNNNQSHSDCQL